MLRPLSRHFAVFAGRPVSSRAYARALDTENSARQSRFCRLVEGSRRARLRAKHLTVMRGFACFHRSQVDAGQHKPCPIFHFVPSRLYQVRRQLRVMRYGRHLLALLFDPQPQAFYELCRKRWVPCYFARHSIHYWFRVNPWAILGLFVCHDHVAILLQSHFAFA
jgi:hypothetical protein